MSPKTSKPEKKQYREHCAGVCILENPYAVDGIYDYAIPPHLEDSVFPGRFVNVPFGITNRRLWGLVVEVRDFTEYKELKRLEVAFPEEISLDGEFLGLCDFMKRRVLCSTGDAVRAMVPASALSKLVSLYEMTGVPLPEKGIDEPTRCVYEHFCASKGALSLDMLRRKFANNVIGKLKRLEKAGVIRSRTLMRQASDGPCETFLTLAVSHDAVASLLLTGECGEASVSSSKQKAVLRVLDACDEPIPQAELRERAEVTDAPIKTLIKNGLITAEKRRIDRNPYASAPFAGQTPLHLNDEQSAALETLSALAFSGEAKAALLHGVTGSGKTCVMTALIDRLLEQQKGVILLLPEIALTPQSVSIFCARYGDRVSVIHSALSAGERYDAYRRIREGRSDVVIGTRSAVFAPVRNLGAIIIDEEQEHTYKSDQNPKYHARDIARYRCAYNKALMLLASATPSLESYKKAMDGVYTPVKLTKRYGNARLPRVEIVDMRREVAIGNLSPIGTRMAEELCRVTHAGEQSVLFLNRRGYNNIVTCRACGLSVDCPSCSVAMTYHTYRNTYQEGDLRCHWCGRRMPLPHICPSCKSEHLTRSGYGTQRIEEEVASLMPSARVLRMDADTTATKTAYDELLGDFRAHRADILLGTQMVTKGHDFPDVTLVGVLMADASLHLDDYRASERTFSMLTQVIGRAGRADKPGLAVIQTNDPGSEIIRFACKGDYEEFYKREIELRRLLVFPPFCDIAAITTTGQHENELVLATAELAKQMQRMLKEQYADVAVVLFGPFEAPVYRVDNRYRLRMVIKCKLNSRTLEFFSEVLCLFSNNVPKKNTIGIDLNPTNV